MSKPLTLVDLFSQQIKKSEILFASSGSEPLSRVASNCIDVFRLTLEELKRGKPADTTFSDSHTNTKNRTDLTRAIADAYGFTLLGENSPHRKYNPVSSRIFEELKIAASALYTSSQYRAPYAKARQPAVTPHELAL